VVERARGKLPPGDKPRALGGVCPGARALAVAALAPERGAVLVVVPTQREAEQLLAGLDLLAPELNAAVLPVECMAAYHGSAPPLGATAAAAAALAGLASGAVRVLVAPASMLLFPLPPPATLARHTPRLRVGLPAPPLAIAQKLAAAGYRRVEIVEEAGDFAVRGEVLDLATPEHFARLVLDGDTIESLREFDPETQRSGAHLPELVVNPLRLFPADQAARERLALWLEEHDCVAAAAAARDGREPALWEVLLGAVHEHSYAWELAAALVACERDAVCGEIERFLQALRRAHAATARDGIALPPPEEWLDDAERCVAALAHADRVEELVLEDGTEWVRLATAPTPNLAGQPKALVDELRRGVAERWAQVVVAASPGEAERFVHLATESELAVERGWPAAGGIGVVAGRLERGFAWHEANLVLFGRADVTTLPAPGRPRRSLARVLAEMRDLAPGDFVVHLDHGIGRFTGFRTLALDGEEHECVELEYAAGGKLLVPIERSDVLEKYASSDGAPARLDRLGGASWARAKARVRRALKDMAEELLRVQAKRELAAGFAFSKDSPWQREFEAAFEYELTADQVQATAEVKRDMESPRPMDRLLIGDVGYGKTEVAMRAAFKAVMDGKQVAVLAPTTILAEQHFRTFARRFEGFPLEIRWLSRFVPKAEQRQTLAALAEGTADIVVGTHRVLAHDVRFRDLGLVVVDEEQRFGVAQKERLKAMKASVDVLALSATPIPRTLNLGLVGLRDVSMIESPPRDRLAVQTHVLPFRREVVREAILHELARGGQVFFVHNRVASIGAIARLLQETVPEARLVVAHGQLHERALETAMDTFLAGRADVLLATAIIENGLDIPNANTLLVNRADRFGLAQLYQLRGRVGRSDRLAFSYLLVPPERSLNREARARLAAILEFADLGAGFRIAARDLEIRGAGNLLGAEQHGHLQAVGYETYCRLLEEAVRELRGEEVGPAVTAVELRLGLDLKLPESFIAEENLRLAAYRRIADARSDEGILGLCDELADRFGSPPAQLGNLALHQRLRRRAEVVGITRISRTAWGFELVIDPTHPRAHGIALALVANARDAALTPDGRLRLPLAEVGAVPAAAALLARLGDAGA